MNTKLVTRNALQLLGFCLVIGIIYFNKDPDIVRDLEWEHYFEQMNEIKPTPVRSPYQHTPIMDKYLKGRDNAVDFLTQRRFKCNPMAQNDLKNALMDRSICDPRNKACLNYFQVFKTVKFDQGFHCQYYSLDRKYEINLFFYKSTLVIYDGRSDYVGL